MRKALFWTPLVVLALFVGLFASGLFKPDDQIHPSKMIGTPLPAFKLPAAASDRPALSRSDLVDGKPRLLNVFASYCVPCAVESPQLMALKARGVEIDAVAVRDRQEDVDRFLARWGNPFRRMGLDARSQLAMAIGSSGYPETFVIDGKGNIRYQHIGVIASDQIPMILDKLKEAS